MKLHPRVTPAAVDLVKRFEGFRPRAAKTPDGRFTIGYGHLLSPRDSADEAAISEAEAEFLLKHDLAVTAEAIEEALLAPVNDNQFAALLSFAFNIGVDNFKGCSALRRLNEGAYLQAAAALELWRRADFGGEVLVVDQLVRRRAVEKALFLAPPEGFMPLPSSVLRPAFDHSVVGAAVAWAAARERTAVSRIALEGPDTSLGLAVPPGREGEPAPSAAIAAADALAVRLSRILPEDEGATDEDAALAAPAESERLSDPHPDSGSGPEQLTLDAEPALQAFPGSEPKATEPESPSVETTPARPSLFSRIAALDFTGAPVAIRADAPLQFTASAEPASPPFASEPKRDDAGFDLPPPPVLRETDVEPVTVAAPAEDALGAQAQYAEAEQAAEPPPFVADADTPTVEPVAMPWRRRFGARAAAEASPFFPSELEEPSLFDAARPAASANFFAAEPAADAADSTVSSTGAPPVPLFERPVFFQVLGLVGIALFAGSIFCMMNKASFGCLLIGVVGILAMAPAAAFFLFRFLGQPIDAGSAEHAEVASLMQAETSSQPEEAVMNEPMEKADSPFDSAWR